MSSTDGELVKVVRLLAMVDDSSEFLTRWSTEEEIGRLRRHERTARPVGELNSVMRLESQPIGCFTRTNPDLSRMPSRVTYGVARSAKPKNT